MGRPRAFDTEDTLRVIMELFWRHGYDGTSFEDIEKATGLKKASLFAAYGNKEALFTKALAMYQTGCGLRLEEACYGTSPKRALSEWLLSQTCANSERNREDKQGRGCLITNTLADLPANSRMCRHAIRVHYEGMESMLIKILKAGIAKAELRQDLDTAIAAKYLVALVTGLQTLSKSPDTLDCTTKQMKALVATAVKSLE